MGYSYYPGMADTIEPAIIERVAPAAWTAFQQSITQVAAGHERKPETVLKDVAREEMHSDQDYDSGDAEYNQAVMEQVITALAVLCKAFTEATGGIGLHIGWVGDDVLRGSDLYDEVFWYISGHKQPTPAYAAFIAAHGTATAKTWVMGG